MIDNPENGHDPELRDKEAGSARDFQTATVVAEPAAQTDQPSPSGPGTSPPTVDPITEPAPTAEVAGNQPATLAESRRAATEPMIEVEFSSELTRFRHSFEEIQAEFIGEPRAAVEKAETLIDTLMNALRTELRRIHSNVKTETDTEQLRVAMLSYRELFGSLGGHRAT
jgi:hypothetical protein